MDSSKCPQLPADAERPALRLLERPLRPLRHVGPPVAGWRLRLHRLVDLIRPRP